MLLTGTDTLSEAAADGRAIAAFAVYNLEMVQAVVTAAELCDRPVLLLAGSSHFRHAGRQALVDIAIGAARRSTAPIGVHLDHCRDLAEIEACLDAGYSSVMIDGSHLPFEENIAITQAAVALARATGAWVEGELGAISGDEDISIDAAPEHTMTDPQQAAEFAERTGVDALAVAIGNVHGLTSTPIALDLKQLARIHSSVGIPLVLHGASGLPDSQLQAAIRGGVAKININAELRRAYLAAISSALPQVIPTHDSITLWQTGRAAVTTSASRYIRLLTPSTSKNDEQPEPAGDDA